MTVSVVVNPHVLTGKVNFFVLSLYQQRCVVAGGLYLEHVH